MFLDINIITSIRKNYENFIHYKSVVSFTIKNKTVLSNSKDTNTTRTLFDRLTKSIRTASVLRLGTSNNYGPNYGSGTH